MIQAGKGAESVSAKTGAQRAAQTRKVLLSRQMPVTRSLAAFWLAASSLLAAQPTFDRSIIDRHRQTYDGSCIPSSVEMVLKLTGRVPPEFFELQQAWKNKLDGSFADFDNRTIAGLTFHRQFALPRNRRFPLRDLFAAIDAELDAGRYVIVALTSGKYVYHNWVIVGHSAHSEYRAVSKNGAETIEIANTRAVIRRMKGTDIGTYTMAP
jgi:hypothetical protein